MEQLTNQGGIPATERVSASATPNWVLPRNKIVERQGDAGSAAVHHHPQVRGGICSFCGVLDPNVESQYQYKLCPHYRGLQLRCTYCPQAKDSDDVNYHAVLNITEHPDNPDKIVVCCNAYDCVRKHEERFKISI